MTNPSEVQGANEEGLAYVTQKIGFYTNIETRLFREQDGAPPPAEKQLFEEQFVSLYQAIIDFQAQTVLRFFRRRFKNLVRDATKWDPWDEMLQRVKNLGDNLEKQSLHFNSISSNASLNALAKWAKNTEEHKCLQCLSRQDYAWYKNRVEDRVPDTCLWFLNHASYHWWLEADSGPLLVSADPGCGKSVLTKYLINSNFGFRVPKEAAICYFFFKEGDQNTIELAFCALAHQLPCQRPRLIRHAVERYEQNGPNLAKNTTALWRILEAATADPEAGTIILVLDALDECLQDERNMKTLAQNIRRHFEYGPRNLKILMTSRPYQNTVGSIQELEELYTNIRIYGEDESEVIRREINLVIEHRITRMKRFDGDFKMNLKKRLLSIPHRTYLWVYLVFEYLQTSTIKQNTQGLNEALKRLPETVEDAYEKILNRSTDPEITRKALSILLGAYKPLTLSQMQIALDINKSITSREMFVLESDETFYSRLRNLCGLFITRYGGRIYFLHQTAREFLLATTASPPCPPTTPGWLHTFALRQVHMVLAESCVLYLIASLNLKKLEDFWRYSCDYWPRHFRRADVPDGAYIVALAAKLLSEPNYRSLGLYDSILNLDCHGIVFASGQGLISVVRLLLSSRFGANLKDKHLALSLAEATRSGHEGVVKLLLDTDRIGVNFRDDNGDTPLHRAIVRGHKGLVKLLLARDGIDVNLGDDDGYTPLHMATVKGYGRIVKELLTIGGVEIDATNRHGRTPLHLAAQNGDEAIVKLLLESKAGVDFKDVNGSTPLTWAVRGGHKATVEMLERYNRD